MKKISLCYLLSGLSLFALGLLLHPLISWFSPGAPLLELVDGVSFSVAMFGLLNVLLGILGLIFNRSLGQLSKPESFLLATGWSISAAVTVHCLMTLLDQFLSSGSPFYLRLPLCLTGAVVGLAGVFLLIRRYCLIREDDTYPSSVTFEFSFAILYTIPMLVVLISIDRFLCSL